MDSPLRIAMWSGPRNISTAMMRAWENRRDTFVTDEPFYAHYLSHTGVRHPGFDTIIKSQATDWRQVVTDCTTSTQPTCTIHYQKHMTHHILPHMQLDWLASLTNVFLIRSPESVVASYSKSRPDLEARDLGFEQQARLFEHVKQHLNDAPLVIASDTLLKNPKAALTALCRHCDTTFDEAMLQWPAGKRDSDGAWAPYWYGNVEQSTGFSPPPEKREIILDDNQQHIADQCRPYYELMATHATDFV